MFRLAFLARTTCCRRSFATTQSILSGHNKWSKIKERKGINDAQKGQLYSRIVRDVAIAIRTGGSGDPALNTQLAAVIKKAREQDVPKDNIERAIEKAQGKNKKGEIMTYEALAFESVGIIIESLTDNLNRTIANLREIFNDHGVQKASVMWMFKKVGRVDVKFPKPADLIVTEEQDAMLEIGFENDVEDFDIVDGDEEGTQLMKLYCPPERVAQLAEAMSKHPSAEIQDRKIAYIPENFNDSLSEESRIKLTKLLDELWADEDTLHIWTTVEK